MCLVVWKKWCLEVRQKKLILLGELVKLKVQRMLFFSLLLLAREKKKRNCGEILTSPAMKLGHEKIRKRKPKTRCHHLIPCIYTCGMNPPRRNKFRSKVLLPAGTLPQCSRFRTQLYFMPLNVLEKETREIVANRNHFLTIYACSQWCGPCTCTFSFFNFKCWEYSLVRR